MSLKTFISIRYNNNNNNNNKLQHKEIFTNLYSNYSFKDRL